MATGLFIDMTQFNQQAAKLLTIDKKFADDVNDSLAADAIDIAADAAARAPVDLGGLHSSISANNDTYLSKEINVNVFYAAFIEFGTGAYAAQYVASLPATWQEYAAQFKGQKGTGTFADFVNNIREWLRHKGIDANAYVVAKSILRKGIKQHPFLYPAYDNARDDVIKHIQTIIENLGH